MKIIISGGGIGGLTAALCCLHFGHEVIVLERAEDLGEVGAGIQVPPNAMKVFEALGLADAFDETGFRPQALEARMGQSGRPLFSIPLGEAGLKRWGSPYFHIHRADYISLLEEAVRKRSPEAVRLGVDVIGFSQTETQISAKLADGSEIAGDILIGADGIHSATRTQMLGPDTPNFTGNVAWRAVVPIEKLGKHAPDPTACVWMGAGKHCVTYRLRRGTLANLVAVVETDDWISEAWTQRGSREEALAEFSDWHPTIRAMIETADAHYRWALFDREPLKTWVDGRAALLGDAAHPMLPFMAQGAAMAVEDAWVLAQEITDSDNTPAALKTYEQKRYARASEVQAGSRANANTFHKRAAGAQFATYGPMWLAGKIAPSIIYRRQDPIYKYDVTALSES
ncbi:MAG: FAD-dependent monooxygenase [Pseudomonadota bacterium]